MGGTSGNIGTVTGIIKIKVPMLPLVLAIVGDCHYKDKSANVTTCSCHSHQQWEEQVVTLSLVTL
jgi:hypothetical protein